ncbi:MAG TPA: helix-turn-helix transcriptional regulator, partial [Rugosimonospora sp.]|nr:helix-turn-helix transcriptional regulator [Rugosimonospora sp.]
GRAEALFHSCGAGALASLAGAHREPPVQPPPCTDRLSPRERQVARLIAEGCSNRQIARALEVSDKTVETHVSSILRKLGVLSRAAVAGIVARGGYAVVPAGRLDDRPAPGGHAVLDE